MVKMTGISKQYMGRPKVFDRVNLELRRGDFLYVVGGTGAGKTSLLRILATEDAPSGGNLTLLNVNLSSAGASSLRAVRRSLGYVPQQASLIPDLSLYDNVALSLAFAARPVGAAEGRARIDTLLAALNLTAERGTKACALSGGQAQRAAVARALVRQPELIVADEPTGSQDREHAWAVMDLLMKANRAGTTVVLATHDHEIVRRVRRPCAWLRGGQLIQENTPQGGTIAPVGAPVARPPQLETGRREAAAFTR